MNKRGQFYLLAAIVIIVIITGFAAVSNYTQKQATVKIYDIKEELDIEIEEVLEYGTTYTTDVDSLIVDFTDKYQEYQVNTGEDKNLYFIFGNQTDVWLVPYELQTVGRISGVVGEEVGYNVEENIAIDPKKQDIINGVVKVEIEGFVYEFELKPGENFFFVISQEVEGEQHIVTS